MPSHPSDEDLKEWILWMTTIFMPLNDDVREKDHHRQRPPHH